MVLSYRYTDCFLVHYFATIWQSTAVVVAHSFGGFVAVTCASLHPRRFGGFLLVDSGIPPPGLEVDYGAPGIATVGRAHRVYRDEADIRARFKMVRRGPPSSSVLPFP